MKHYGERFVRNADLEVVSYDEKNGSVPLYITWDAKTEQSFAHVTRLIHYMLAVSKTSLQAAGLEEAKGESGVALLYLWIQSVIKAEAVQSKFDSALKAAIRKCIILENALGGKDMEVKDRSSSGATCYRKQKRRVIAKKLKICCRCAVARNYCSSIEKELVQESNRGRGAEDS